GYIQFGFDYSSLEARIQGHFVTPYEGGEELAYSLLQEKPNDVHCYSEDTEILTTDGWKTFGELTIKSKVAQYNPDNNKIEMVTPIDIVWQKYEGGMINMKSMSTDQLVTPNHRVISYTEAGRVVIDLAEDIKPLEGRHFKTGGVLEDGNDLIRIQDDFIRLIIATQADGHLNKDCSAITFTFVRPDKTLRL